MTRNKELYLPIALSMALTLVSGLLCGFLGGPWAALTGSGSVLLTTLLWMSTTWSRYKKLQELEQKKAYIESLPEKDAKDNRIYNYVTEDSEPYNKDTADGTAENPYIYYCNKDVFAYGSFYNSLRPQKKSGRRVGSVGFFWSGRSIWSAGRDLRLARRQRRIRSLVNAAF